MAHIRLDLTRMFFVFRSRWAMAGLPAQPNPYPTRRLHLFLWRFDRNSSFLWGTMTGLLEKSLLSVYLECRGCPCAGGRGRWRWRGPFWPWWSCPLYSGSNNQTESRSRGSRSPTTAASTFHYLQSTTTTTVMNIQSVNCTEIDQCVLQFQLPAHFSFNQIESRVDHFEFEPVTIPVVIEYCWNGTGHQFRIPIIQDLFRVDRCYY